jgi:hypothetical protein
MSGTLETTKPVVDETLGVQVDRCLKLERKVEMFQYVETTKTSDNNGSNSEQVIEKQWSETKQSLTDN